MVAACHQVMRIFICQKTADKHSIKHTDTRNSDQLQIY